MKHFYSLCLVALLSGSSFSASAADEVAAVIFRQKPNVACNASLRQDYCALTTKNSNKFGTTVFCSGNKDGKTCPTFSKCQTEWESTKSKTAISRVLEGKGVMKKCFNGKDTDKFGMRVLQPKALATSAPDSCNNGNRFEPVCISDETMCGLDPEFLSAGMICRSSQCGDISSCIEDSAWDVIQDVKMVDEKESGSQGKPQGMPDGGGGAPAMGTEKASPQAEGGGGAPAL